MPKQSHPTPDYSQNEDDRIKRDAMRFGTSAGIPLTDDLINELAQEAEEGYSTERLRPRNPHTHS